MKTKVKAVLVMIAVGSALAVPFGAGASHPACGTVVVDREAGGTRIYVDDRGENGIWVYSESNGRAGLQRGGSHFLLNYPDGCVDHEVPADTLIF